MAVMKSKVISYFFGLSIIGLFACTGRQDEQAVGLAFLHHSTGSVIWEGDPSRLDPVVVKKNSRLKAQLPIMFAEYNEEHTKNYAIKEIIFPKAEPYGWNNYPYDYYNIWVKNAGEKPFMKEPTLEMLTSQFQVIVFKHCFPSSNILGDNGIADINSDIKTLSNYKQQYLALRDKIHEFSDNKFILFTGAVQVKSFLSEEEAIRAREFYNWVVNDWDLPDDNIFIWDLYQLQTEGGLYFKDEYAVSPNDSHPNKEFAGMAANLLFNRIIDIIENNGTTTDLAGNLI